MIDSSTPNAEALVDSTNPYQAPRSESPVDFEQKFARRLLSLRHKQLTLRRLYRMQLKVMAILLVTFGDSRHLFRLAQPPAGRLCDVGRAWRRIAQGLRNRPCTKARLADSDEAAQLGKGRADGRW